MLDGVQLGVISPGGTKGGSNHWTVCSDNLAVYEQPILGVSRQFDDEIAALEPQIRQIALVQRGWVARGQKAVVAVCLLVEETLRRRVWQLTYLATVPFGDNLLCGAISTSVVCESWCERGNTKRTA